MKSLQKLEKFGIVFYLILIFDIELKELLENGLITEVEYESKRSHILNDI